MVMSDRWKAFLILSLVFNIAVIATLAFGLFRMSRVEQRPAHRRYDTKEMMGPRCRRLAEYMELPREKTVHFERIMTGSEERIDSVRTRLREARGQLFELMWAEEPQNDAVLEKVDEVAALQGELERLLIMRLLDARKILDPEEEERFIRHMRNRMEPPSHLERYQRDVPRRHGGTR